MTDPRMARLVALTEMIRDHALGQLQKESAAIARTRARLADLGTPMAGTGEDMALALAALRHQQWAEAQRRELNAQLARQTVAWLAARDDAGRAFGRAEALARLARSARR